MALSQRTKDYITIWNEGISGLYMAYGFIAVAALITTIETCSKLKANGPSACSWSDPSSFLTIGMSIVMFIAGLANFFYTRRYFRSDNLRTIPGFIATFSLAIANGYMAFEIIKSLNATMSYAASSSSIGTTLLFGGGTASWAAWTILAAVVVSFVMSIMAIAIQFTWSPITIEEEPKTGSKMPEIAADVATHAMGHAEPTINDAAVAMAEKKEKDLPPMLSADAAEPVVNHRVGIVPTETQPQLAQSAPTESADPLDDFGKL